MKILLLLSASCLMLLSACKKDNNAGAEKSEAEDTKYDVKFTVDGFNQSVSNFSISGKKTLDIGDTLKNYTDNFVYRIYNSAGVYVNGVDQNSGDPGTYGTVSDQLPSGTYTVCFAAAKGSLFASSATPALPIAYFFPASTWNDTFAKVLQLTVSNSSVTQTVRLDRVVGGLEITLEDAIPTGTAKISIFCKNEPISTSWNSIGASSNGVTVRNFVIATADIGQKNKKFFSYIMNTTSASSVVIRAFDANNGLLAEKTVDRVQCYKNKKTSLSGSLFPTSVSASTAFTVAVNPGWDTTTPSTPINF